MTKWNYIFMYYVYTTANWCSIYNKNIFIPTSQENHLLIKIIRETQSCGTLFSDAGRICDLSDADFGYNPTPRLTSLQNA